MKKAILFILLVPFYSTAQVVNPAGAASAGTLTGTTLASNIVNSSLTTVGTITTGVWNGTPIANAYLANSATTVNGQTCTLGSTCTITAAAGTLTGTTLSSTVVASSLTSVGTLTSLSMAGNIIPTVAATDNIGSAAYPYENIYSNFVVSGTNAYLRLSPAYGMFGVMQTNSVDRYYWTSAAFYPFVTNSYTLGTASNVWSNVYTTALTATGLTGYTYCNGTSACTAATTIPYSSVSGGPTYATPSTATLTAGTGVTSVTCATATCTNLRGTLSIVGGTATTGTVAALSWTATSAAYVCTATMNGGATSYGIGNSVATTTGMNITSAVSVLGINLTVNYSCQP